MFGKCNCGICVAIQRIDDWMSEKILNMDVEFVLVCIGQDEYFNFGDSLDLPCRVKPK